MSDLGGFSGVDRDVVDRVLAVGLRGGGEFVEVFFEDKVLSSAFLDDGRVEELSSGRRRGAGVRVVLGDTTGFAHTADVSEVGLLRAVDAAVAAARATSGGVNAVGLPAAPVLFRVPADVDPFSVDKGVKVGLLLEADEVAREFSGAVSQVSASYGDSRRRILVANSEGVFAADDVTRTVFSVSCVARGDTGMQTGREVVGGTVGFELFDGVERPSGVSGGVSGVGVLAERAANKAVVKLGARPAPSGKMPVVIGPGGGGVLFHEACGHGLEADLVGKGASVFAGRVGKRVASELVSVVDDATMAGEWGQFSVDDEGSPARRSVLIEDGVLVDYMWDGLRARKEGRGVSGNGRRESYQHLPMVRMTNTYLSAGESDPADIVASTERGVYVAGLGGGQVNTATGDFVFGMTEAYMIEGGEITEPVREGNLIGNGPQVLAAIDAVGDDFAMGSPGTCGKDGQGVPVGDGVPTLRVTELTVGGTAG